MDLTGGIIASVVLPVRTVASTVIPGGVYAVPMVAQGGGAASTAAGTASGPISALRAVKYVGLHGIAYVDWSDPGDAHLAVGVTVTAAATGGSVGIATAGPVVDQSWSWTPGPVWIGPDGTLTQTPPALPAAWSRIIGAAESPTLLWVAPQAPITL